MDLMSFLFGTKPMLNSVFDSLIHNKFTINFTSFDMFVFPYLKTFFFGN